MREKRSFHLYIHAYEEIPKDHLNYDINTQFSKAKISCGFHNNVHKKMQLCVYVYH